MRLVGQFISFLATRVNHALPIFLISWKWKGPSFPLLHYVSHVNEKIHVFMIKAGCKQVNNSRADQAIQMCILVCAFIGRSRIPEGGSNLQMGFDLLILPNYIYSKTCVKWPLSKRPKNGFQDRLLFKAGQKYCRMLPLQNAPKGAFYNTFDLH